MPYTIERRGTEHCVVKEGDGKTLGCHATQEAAQKQIFAINMSERKIPGVKPRQKKG